MNRWLIVLAVSMTAAGCGSPAERASKAPPPEVEASAKFDAYAALTEQALRRSQAMVALGIPGR